MSDALLKNTFNKISPAYELVADVTIGTATTQVDFSGLNFGKDDDLMLVSDVINQTASTASLRLFVNDNVTETNYYTQTLNADGTTVNGARVNDNIFNIANLSGGKGIAITKIKLTNSGYYVYQSDFIRSYGSSSLILYNRYCSSVFTISSITKISIISNIINSIGVGSRFQLYRLKAKKVFDIILFSEMDEIDITGFNIEKDSEYMLVGNVVNDSATTTTFSLFPNDNKTQTNYYNQNILANSTSVSAGRTNTNNFMPSYAGYKNFSMTKIKLTNNGYFIYQADCIPRYAGADVFFLKNYGTSTFTMTSITKLTIVANATNTMGGGSRFTLYKMR